MFSVHRRTDRRSMITFILTHQQRLRQGSSTSISRGSCEESWLLPVCRICIFSSRVLEAEGAWFSPLSVKSSNDTYYSVWVWNWVLHAQQLKLFVNHSSSVILQLADPVSTDLHVTYRPDKTAHLQHTVFCALRHNFSLAMFSAT